MNTNNQPPYDPYQYDPTVNRGYYDPTQYRPAADPSQYKSTQPNQASTQPPYIPAPTMATDPYSTPSYGAPIPSDPYQANNYGTPPHFTGSYAPNPYLPTPPPPPGALSPYGKKLFLGLASTFLFSFILVGSTPETTTTQSTPPSVDLGISLLIGIIVCVFVVDWRGFFNLEGLLQWRQMSPNRRLSIGCLFLFFYPIFAFIYAIRAGFKAFTGQDRLFTKEWDMPQPAKRRAKIGMISGSVVALFFFIVSLFANTSASAQGSSTSVTPAATHASQGATSTQNQKAITPTPTTKPKPTPSPTPTVAPKWTVVQTFTGNGNKKTPTFSVPDSWRIVWSCDPSSDYFGSYNVIVGVDNADGSTLDYGAVNTICKAGNTTDFTEEHQGGSVYLDVESEGAWTLKVEVLK